MKALPLAVAGCALVLLAGCSPSANQAAASQGSASTLAATTSTPAKPPATTDAVIATFKAKGMPIGMTLTFTAATDPNQLLGRPNGYTAKESWVDTRIDPTQAKGTTPGSVALGGSVEEFTNTSDAKARSDYIQETEKAVKIVGVEYDYVAGDFLLRVSQALTPDQAAEYQAALK